MVYGAAGILCHNQRKRRPKTTKQRVENEQEIQTDMRYITFDILHDIDAATALCGDSQDRG
jgi:hypothetical protein